MKTNTSKRAVTFILFLVFSHIHSNAQCLTGTWEGQLVSGVFLQMNIVESSAGVCGSSYDYVRSDPGNYCKQYLSIIHDPSKDEWIISSLSFAGSVNKAGSKHLPLHLLLKYSEKNGKAVLSGTGYDQRFLTKNSRDEVYLERISDTLREILPGLADCMRNAVATKSTPPAISGAVSDMSKNIASGENMTKRSLNNISAIRTSSKKLKIRLFDNAVVDDDTVSVFYDGQLILAKKRLTNHAIDIELNVVPDGRPHQLVLYAENLGRIPPNTARLIILDDKARYELNASYDMKANASVIIQYDP